MNIFAMRPPLKLFRKWLNPYYIAAANMCQHAVYFTTKANERKRAAPSNWNAGPDAANEHGLDAAGDRRAFRRIVAILIGPGIGERQYLGREACQRRTRA